MGFLEKASIANKATPGRGKDTVVMNGTAFRTGCKDGQRRLRKGTQKVI
jgi:hypothetical protein